MCIDSETPSTYWHKSWFLFSLLLLQEVKRKCMCLNLNNSLNYYDYSLKAKMSGYSLYQSNSSLRY